MTQLTGGPGEGVEPLKIQNPNLPEGFEITEEMLQDPSIKFFLENYVGPFKVTIENSKEIGDLVPFLNDENGNEITQAHSYFNPINSLKLMEFDFKDFYFYGYHFLFDGKIYSADTHENSRIDILKHFLPPNMRDEFVGLFSQTQFFDWIMSNIMSEVDSLTDMVDRGVQDPEIIALMKERISKVVATLNGEITKLS